MILIYLLISGKMTKRDLRYMKAMASRFRLDERELSEYVHGLKGEVDGNPDVRIDRYGTIHVGSEVLGSVEELRSQYTVQNFS